MIYLQTVLKDDKTNYNAWVFVGAAAQEIDQLEQSEAAFKRAIEISPEQMLAWQVNFLSRYAFFGICIYLLYFFPYFLVFSR